MAFESSVQDKLNLFLYLTYWTSEFLVNGDFSQKVRKKISQKE